MQTKELSQQFRRRYWEGLQNWSDTSLQLATVKPNKMKLTVQPVPTPSASHPQHSFPTLPVSEGMVLHMRTLRSYVGDL